MLSKRSLPLIIISLTIIVGIFAIYFFLTHTPAPTTPPNNTPPVTDNNQIDTSDWVAYSNQQLGVSFKYSDNNWDILYPDSSVGDSWQSDVNDFFNNKLDSVTVVALRDTTTGNLDYYDVFGFSLVHPGAFNNVDLANYKQEFKVPGAIVRYKGINTEINPNSFEAFAITDSGNTYHISATSTFADRDGREKLFLEMLKTFKFE